MLLTIFGFFKGVNNLVAMLWLCHSGLGRVGFVEMNDGNYGMESDFSFLQIFAIPESVANMKIVFCSVDEKTMQNFDVLKIDFTISNES